MKKEIKRALLVIAVTIFGLAPAFADNDKPISKEQLPQVAQNILNREFKGKSIALAKMETDILDRSYDVIFTNGDKIEFDKKGNWTSVDCSRSGVPAGIVPSAISKYVNTNYKGAQIKEIERERKQYKIELSNGLEIKFNKNFKVIEIDR